LPGKPSFVQRPALWSTGNRTKMDKTKDLLV
jgi:hypothetical protein